MKKYQLKPSDDSPPPPLEWGTTWQEKPATNRQLKVLRFFGIPFEQGITRGHATGCVCGIFGNAKKTERWRKYVFLTKDITDKSPHLEPFDPAELERVVLPPGWKYGTILTEAPMSETELEDRRALAKEYEESERAELAEAMKTLPAFGYSSDGLSQFDVVEVFRALIRPMHVAVRNAFENSEILNPDELLALRVALKGWDRLPKLPQPGVNPYQQYSKDECARVMDIAVRILPPVAFLQLIPKNAKRHKRALDEILRKREA